MKLKILFTALLFSIIFNIVFVVHMQSDRHSGSENSFPGFVLDDSQKKKITKESAGIIDENFKLEGKLEKCRQDLYNLLDSKVTDRTEIDKCITTINDIQKKIQLNTVDQLLIYKKHMTEEQCRCLLKEFGDKMNVHHQCSENCSCNN